MTKLRGQTFSLVVFIVVFSFYAASAYPSLAARDGCDLALSALTLQPAHPPGYPLYSLVGRLWLALVPFGSPAYRLNLLSAFTAAAACALFFVWCRKRCGAAAAAALTAALACCGPLRKFGVLPEMYSAQALALCALLALSDGEPKSSTKRAAASGLVFGLGLVNHQTLILFLPALLWLWRRELSEVLAPALGGVIVGLLPELFLAVRLGPSLAVQTILRAQYGGLELSQSFARAMTPDLAGALLHHWALGALFLLSPFAAALAAVGLGRAWREGGKPRDEAVALLLALFAFGPVFFLLTRFDLSEWVAASVLESAFVSTAVPLAALAALGLAAVRLPRARMAAAVAAASWTLALGSGDGWHRDDFSARDYVSSVERLLPPDSAVLVAGDTALFGLRFDQASRGGDLKILSVLEEDPAGWLRAQARERPAYAVGMPERILDQLNLLGPRGLQPQGLVQRLTGPALTEDAAWRLAALRPSRALDGGESYAHDARLSFAFAHYLSGILDERLRRPVDLHAQRAAALDPEDYRVSVQPPPR